MKQPKKNPGNKYYHYQKEILNTISEPATFISKAYKYIFVNSAFNKFFNWETKDIIGQTVETIWKDSVFGKHIKSGIRKGLKGETVSLQFEGRIPGGDYKILEMNYYPHRNSSRRIDGVIITTKDITEQKKTEQFLKENEAHLLELNATKDKFFSIIGHDLQGPLNNIMGFSEIIEDGYDQFTDKEIRDYNRVIYQLSQSVSEILDNLLTWARSQRNQIKFNPQKVSLPFIIDKCYSFLIHSINQKQIIFRDQVSTDTMVFADEEMITIVMRNLLSNAIKFTPRKGSITLFSSLKVDHVVVGVSDTGIGIPADKIHDVFNIINNHTNSGTEGETGTGIGLVICKEFVERNGGEIWVESIPGKGSTFYFSIPSAVNKRSIITHSRQFLS